MLRVEVLNQYHGDIRARREGADQFREGLEPARGRSHAHDGECALFLWGFGGRLHWRGCRFRLCDATIGRLECHRRRGAVGLLTSFLGVFWLIWHGLTPERV